MSGVTLRRRAAIAGAISEHKALQLAVEALNDRAQEFALDANMFKKFGDPALKKSHDRYRELKAAAELLQQKLESYWAAG